MALWSHLGPSPEFGTLLERLSQSKWGWTVPSLSLGIHPPDRRNKHETIETVKLFVDKIASYDVTWFIIIDKKVKVILDDSSVAQSLSL